MRKAQCSRRARTLSTKERENHPHREILASGSSSTQRIRGSNSPAQIVCDINEKPVKCRLMIRPRARGATATTAVAGG